MGRTKRLKELTIKDNFMFGAVMMDEENCKGLLERVLEIPIERVEVSRQKSGSWKTMPLLPESDGHGDAADRRRVY